MIKPINLSDTSISIPDAITAIMPKNTDDQINNSSWAVAYGLCIMGIDSDGEESGGMKLAKRTKNNLGAWLKQFLP